MAGGPNANVVMCLKCTEKANRISEGLEDDYYECEMCGYRFGIDWSLDGPPEKPCWPPSPEEIEAAKKVGALIGISGAEMARGEPANHEPVQQRRWWQFWK